jgi:hypothetical protein
MEMIKARLDLIEQRLTRNYDLMKKIEVDIEKILIAMHLPLDRR